MPADINKTIEIAYRADVKNIIDGLTKTGRVSEKEAQRIGKSLEQAYEKATRDSEKAAKKQQAAMAKTEKSAKSLGQSIGKSFSGIVTAIGAASVAAVMFGQHIAGHVQSAGGCQCQDRCECRYSQWAETCSRRCWAQL